MNEEKGELAFSLHAAITNNEMERRSLMYKNMKLIHEIHSNKLYQTILGDDEAPWSAYLAQHDTYYSASKVYMLDKIYGKFIKELGLQSHMIFDIPDSKLSNLIKIVNKENVDEWLNKARVLTSHDFEDELRKATGKVSYLECPHSNQITYQICQSCGFRHKGEHYEEGKN